MTRTFASPMNLLAALCVAVSLPASAQSYPQPLQEVSKCVRGGDVFYTQGDCPKGARSMQLGGDPMPEQRRASNSRSEHSLSTNSTPTRRHDAGRSDTAHAGESGGFRPLNSFPPLPADMSTRSHDTRPELRESPVRAAGRPMEHTPVPDAQANNQVMCGFVAAELSRLATEAAAATDDANKARIATHQKRLNERAEQLKCPA